MCYGGPLQDPNSLSCHWWSCLLLDSGFQKHVFRAFWILVDFAVPSNKYLTTEAHISSVSIKQGSLNWRGLWEWKAMNCHISTAMCGKRMTKLEFIMSKMSLGVKCLTQRRLDEAVNDKTPRVWLCYQRGALYHRSSDSVWGYHLVCAACWLITSAGFLLLQGTWFSSPSITPPTSLSLQSPHSTCSSLASLLRFLPRFSNGRISWILRSCDL